MKGFLKYYKWELNNELYTSIYFVAILSLYSIFILIHGERSVDIFIMLEMLLVCYAISVFQKFMFNEDKELDRKALIIRTTIWFTGTMVFVVSMSIIFGWFTGMKAWALGAFIAYMVVCFIAIWVGIHIANKLDTKNLNHMLNQYQERRK